MVVSKLWRWISADRLVVLTLVFIFGLGLFLRLYRLGDFTSWQDSARDFMVAQEIFSTTRPFGTVMPLAAGSAGFINNSPIYYYLLGLLVKILPNPLLLAGFVAGLGNLAVLFNFFLGKRLGDEKTGLIAAFLTAISFTLIVQSSSVVQPNFIPALASFFVLCLVLAYERRSFYWALSSIVAFWSFFHIHYSVFLMAPLFIGGMMAVIWRLRDTSWFKLKLGYLLIVFAVGGFLWVILTSQSSSLNLLNFVLTESNQAQAQGAINFFAKYQQFLSYYWQSISLGWAQALVGLGAVLVGIDIYRKHQKKQNIFFELMLAGVFISLTGLTLFSREVFDAYFIIQFTFLPLLLTQLIWLLAKWQPWLALAILMWLAGWLNSGNGRLANPQIGQYEASQLVAQAIINDMGAKDLTKLSQIYVTSKNRLIPTYDWSSPKYWYFLEQLFGQKNSQVVSGFNNLMWRSPEPEFFYLICEEFALEEEQRVVDGCLQPFLDQFGQILEPELEKLTVESVVESVFVLKIKENVAIKNYWPFRLVE